MTSEQSAWPELPIGVQHFATLRRDGLLYVDKTVHLLRLVKSGRRYFLSRLRRFGKSLTLSTLDAMFSGQSELFQGLAAEEWVRQQAKRPAPVVRLSMARMDVDHGPEGLSTSLARELARMAARNGLQLPKGDALEAFRI